jgi:acetolactate synthase-1/2/3 large subunit
MDRIFSDGRTVHELKQFLSSVVTVCLDMGSFHPWIARHLSSFRPRQVLITNGQQTLGVALPWGIAGTLIRQASGWVIGFSEST